MRLGYTTRIRGSVGDPTLTEFFNSKIPQPGALWPAVCPSLQQYVSMHCQAPCHRLLPPSCAPESFSYPPSYFSLSLICNPPLPSCLLSCFFSVCTNEMSWNICKAWQAKYVVIAPAPSISFSFKAHCSPAGPYKTLALNDKNTDTITFVRVTVYVPWWHLCNKPLYHIHITCSWPDYHIRLFHYMRWGRCW